MAIDLKRCIGCRQISFKAENGTPPRVFFARVVKQEEGRYPTVHRLFLPVLRRDDSLHVFHFRLRRIA